MGFFGLNFDQENEKNKSKSCDSDSVPLNSPLPSAPPREAALYPFRGMEVKGWVTTRTMVTEG